MQLVVFNDSAQLSSVRSSPSSMYTRTSEPLLCLDLDTTTFVLPAIGPHENHRIHLMEPGRGNMRGHQQQIWILQERHFLQ